MRINNVQHSPKLEKICNVQFGSLIRVWDVPDYWPNYLKKRNGRFGNYFLLTSEYYRSSARVSSTNQQLLIVDVATGEGIGLNSAEKVEVISNAEVHLNENRQS